MYDPSAPVEASLETPPTTPTSVPAPDPTPEPTPAYDDRLVYELTAYCPCEKCCGKTDGITASGTQATAGRTIAVDPRVFPYGTKVIVDGHEYVAEDTGGAIKGARLDIFFDTHEEALNFGRRTTQDVDVDLKGE